MCSVLPITVSFWEVANSNVVDTVQIHSMKSVGTKLFAGNDNGVYYSTNLALNWTLLNNGLPKIAILSLESNGDFLYAGTKGSGLWKLDVTVLGA